MKQLKSVFLASGCSLIALITIQAQTPLVVEIHPAAEITWPATSSGVYQVQRSPDMSPNSWTNVGEPFLGDGITNYVDHTSRAGAAFYQVVTLPQPLIVDPPGNLTGEPPGNPTNDQTRAFMDIVGATALAEGTNCALTVVVAAPLPTSLQMTNGKRFDFIFWIDGDQNLGTGQGPAGNDYNLHLYLDENGWSVWWGKVSTFSENDGITIDGSKFQFRVAGNRASLIFPKYFLPRSAFGMWLSCHSGIAQNWDPMTQQLWTAREEFVF